MMSEVEDVASRSATVTAWIRRKLGLLGGSQIGGKGVCNVHSAREAEKSR